MMKNVFMEFGALCSPGKDVLKDILQERVHLAILSAQWGLNYMQYYS
jgi:hypothetical protein